MLKWFHIFTSNLQLRVENIRLKKELAQVKQINCLRAKIEQMDDEMLACTFDMIDFNVRQCQTIAEVNACMDQALKLLPLETQGRLMYLRREKS